MKHLLLFCALISSVCFGLVFLEKNENLFNFNGANEQIPVVLYHGMGDTFDGSINGIKSFLEQYLTGIYVYSVQMGKSKDDDLINSYFMNLNDQVEATCQIIKSDPKLANGYNAIGYSQGCQILRAIAQRCPEPPMLNLISFGGQHQGVYGVPKCPGENKTLCDLARRLLNYGAYLGFVQQHSCQAEYWHDPLQEEVYKQKSIFLADINNEVTRNQSYRQGLLGLKNFVMVKFLNDTIVDPKETEHFGFYYPGQAEKVYTLKESPLYQEDWLGLKALDESGRLHLYEVIGDHLQLDFDWFKSEIVDKFLV